MTTYVSDWSQEVYGDIRAHAVPGIPTSTRREYLNDYLQHKLVLAGAGPTEIEPAHRLPDVPVTVTETVPVVAVLLAATVS